MKTGRLGMSSYPTAMSSYRPSGGSSVRIASSPDSPTLSESPPLPSPAPSVCPQHRNNTSPCPEKSRRNTSLQKHITVNDYTTKNY